MSEEIKKRIEQVKKKRDTIIERCMDERLVVDTHGDFPYKIDPLFISYLKKQGVKRLFRKTIKKFRQTFKGHNWRFRSIIGGSTNKFFRLVGKYKWDLIKKCLEIIKEHTESYNIYKEKKHLCHLTKCYKDLTRSKRTKIALKVCENCGTNNNIESLFCSMCGGKF